MWSTSKLTDAAPPAVGNLFWDEVYRIADGLQVPPFEWFMGWDLARLR